MRLGKGPKSWGLGKNCATDLGREGPKRDGVGPTLCIREGLEERERRLNVCKPTPMVLPLSAVDPKVAPCLRPLLNPASSPPPQ